MRDGLPSRKGRAAELKAAACLHLDEKVSLRDVARATGVPRSTLRRHVTKEKTSRKMRDEASRRRFRRLQQQRLEPEWIGWAQNGGIEWFSPPQEVSLEESVRLTDEARDELAECLGLNPEHPILSYWQSFNDDEDGAVEFALTRYVAMERAVQQAPNQRRGPNRVARDILQTWLFDSFDRYYCGPEEDRTVMRAEFIRAALAVVGAPCEAWEPKNGKAPRASRSRLMRLAQSRQKSAR